MVEIKGFNEAYNNMLAIEAMKKIKKQTIKRSEYSVAAKPSVRKNGNHLSG